MPNDSSKSEARARLVKISRETLNELPEILKSRPELDATSSSFMSFNDLQSLDPINSPQRPSITTRVIDKDSLDAAVYIVNQTTKSASNTSAIDVADRPLVMNFASDNNPGGGWLTGAQAQEECLCYCSSLSMSLHKKHYPIPLHKFSYTRDVLIIRDADMNLLVPPTKPEDLPVVSCISIAALRRPELANDKYARESDREWMRKKMRATLRLAALEGHTKLVLGAFGCGAFKNPADEVAELWKQVLSEKEFSHGWWEAIVFAVLSRDGGSQGQHNFETFKSALDGLVIGT